MVKPNINQFLYINRYFLIVWVLLFWSWPATLKFQTVVTVGSSSGKAASHQSSPAVRSVFLKSWPIVLIVPFINLVVFH